MTLFDELDRRYRVVNKVVLFKNQLKTTEHYCRPLHIQSRFNLLTNQQYNLCGILILGDTAYNGRLINKLTKKKWRHCTSVAIFLTIWFDV